MCGIAGAFGFVAEDTAAAVDAMNDAQHHRGPDGGSRWSGGNAATGKGVVLAHRRLAIIDLSEIAFQPMCDPDTGNQIVFNGEIYNFAEVRAELAALGHRFVTHGDTEVILKGYAQWGWDCLRRLRGMFAFALWEAATGSLHLVRDRLGVKPLYYAYAQHPADRSRRVLLFASELRALLASGLVDRRLDPEGLRSFLWNGFVVGPGTLVRGVRLLEPATILSIADANAEPRAARFWSMPAAGGRAADPEGVHECLRDAVRLRLVSDVPLGVFLSGGVDSSAVSALASEVCEGNLATFNIGFENSALDESRYAAAVAEALGTRHTSIVLTDAMFRQHVDEALASVDQPTFDGINSYFVSRAVKEAGITVALAGTGGDELFGGYRSFATLPRIHGLLGAVPVIARAAAMLGRGLGALYAAAGAGRVPSQQRLGKLPELLQGGAELWKLYQVGYALFTEDFQRRLVAPGFAGAPGYGVPPELVERLRGLGEGTDALQAVSRLELAQFVGQRLLRDVDTTSMAVSLEVREPLLDHVLIETLAGLEPQSRYFPLGSKRLLRQAALQRIPPEIFDRPKSGFELPLTAWLRKDLGSLVEETLCDRRAVSDAGLDPDTVAALWRAHRSSGGRIYWSRPWALFALVDYVRRNGLRA